MVATLAPNLARGMLVFAPVPRLVRLAVPVLLVSCASAPVTPVPAPVVVKPAVSAVPPPVVEPSYEVTSTSEVSAVDDHAWPPPKNGGADWVAYDRPWLHKIAGAPPTFYTTSVQPDPKRKNKVDVVALDARQLDLDMAVGKEGPWPPDEKTAGKWPRAGVGKLPRDPAVATRVVVAFNGAFRLDHDAHGMMIRRRTFAPAVKDVASLLMHDDGRLGFGTWPLGMQLPDDVRSLRQNLDPLLEDGVVNPHARKRWGGILGGAKQQGQRAKRSGLCRTAGGHLLYLWGDGLEPTHLGAAMKDVGCEYGMHLDMNAIHVGMVFMSYDDAQYKKGHSEALSPGMGISATKYIHAPNPKEFFYATLRAPYDASFAPDGQVQPPPAWQPTVLTRSDGDVRVTFVDHRHVRFALTVGHDELDGAGKRRVEPPSTLAGNALRRVLAALDLGAAKSPLGLVANGTELSPMKDAAVALVVGDDGRLALGAAAGAKWAVQVQPVDPQSLPPDLGVLFGLTARGDLVLGEGGTPGARIEALRHAGCVSIVRPRGDGRFERAGRDSILSGGRGTRLYVLAVRPDDTTYRFDRKPR